MEFKPEGLRDGSLEPVAFAWTPVVFVEGKREGAFLMTTWSPPLLSCNPEVSCPCRGRSLYPAYLESLEMWLQVSPWIMPV